jgi:hypothetical protein
MLSHPIALLYASSIPPLFSLFPHQRIMEGLLLFFKFDKGRRMLAAISFRTRDEQDALMTFSFSMVSYLVAFGAKNDFPSVCLFSSNSFGRLLLSTLPSTRSTLSMLFKSLRESIGIISLPQQNQHMWPHGPRIWSCSLSSLFRRNASSLFSMAWWVHCFRMIISSNTSSNLRVFSALISFCCVCWICRKIWLKDSTDTTLQQMYGLVSNGVWLVIVYTRVFVLSLWPKNE